MGLKTPSISILVDYKVILNTSRYAMERQDEKEKLMTTVNDGTVFGGM